MLIIQISLDVSGVFFSPKKFHQIVNDDYFVFSEQEPLINSDNQELNEDGYLSILNPQKMGIQYELSEYEEWYITFLRKNRDILIKLGVESINLFFDVFYTNQCNFEIFDKEKLKNISEYNVSIPVSVYLVSNDEIREMLLESGYSKVKIENLDIENN